jgi:hypothetical protein
MPDQKSLIVQSGERDEVLDQGSPALGALTEADGAHLGETPERLGDALSGRFDPRDQRGGHGPEPGEQDAEFAGGGLDVVCVWHSNLSYGFGARMSVGSSDSGTGSSRGTPVARL